jgi:hypothetical protein
MDRTYNSLESGCEWYCEPVRKDCQVSDDETENCKQKVDQCVAFCEFA